MARSTVRIDFLRALDAMRAIYDGRRLAVSDESHAPAVRAAWRADLAEPGGAAVRDAFGTGWPAGDDVGGPIAPHPLLVDRLTLAEWETAFNAWIERPGPQGRHAVTPRSKWITIAPLAAKVEGVTVDAQSLRRAWTRWNRSKALAGIPRHNKSRI